MNADEKKVDERGIDKAVEGEYGKEKTQVSPLLTKLAFANIVAIFLLILLGNIVSSAGAGLACPDWPLCHGKIIPPLEPDVLLEYSHRLVGLFVSLLTVALVILGIKSGHRSIRKLSIFVVFLLLFQIVLGGVVVLLELPFHLTSLHLLIAFLILSSVVFIFALSSGKKFSAPRHQKILLAVVLIQIILGGIVRHKGAGTACPNFPECYTEFLPPPTQEAVLNFIHRWNGIAIAVFSAFVGKVFAFLSVVQALLGILTSTDFSIFTRALHAGFGYFLYLFILLKSFK